MFYVMVSDGGMMVRAGRMMIREKSAIQFAKKRRGKCFECDGMSTKLVADFHVDPEPEPKLKFKDWRAKFNAAQLFQTCS